MNEKEKNASIEYILARGLVKPPTPWERISKMHRVLGLKFIFWDLSYSIIFVSVTLLGVTFMLQHAPMDYPYSLALGFSPLLFLLIILFSELNERACGLYELKQTCRYTSRQITALRCIYYSLAGMAFTVIVAAFAAESTTQFFKVLPLCLGGLFLCAATSLSVIRLTHNRWNIVVLSVAWVFINLSLPIALRENWELFLSGLQLVFTIAFMMAGAAVFMYQTNKMLMEGKQYAIA